MEGKLGYSDVVTRVEQVNYGRLAVQVRDVTRRLARNEPVEWAKFGQISDNTKNLLANPNNVPHSELPIILSHLLTTPTPSAQDGIVKSVEPLMTTRELDLASERRGLYRAILADYIFEEYTDSMTEPYTFFSDPANQKRFPDAFKSVFNVIEKYHDEFGITFFKNPANIAGNEELLNALFEQLNRRHKNTLYPFVKSLLPFFENPENRIGREELFEQAFNGAVEMGLERGNKDSRELEMQFLVDFMSIPANQKGREEIMQRIFAEIPNISEEYQLDYLLKIYSYPENRMGREENFNTTFNKAVVGLEKGDKYSAQALLKYFERPDNQTGYEDLVDQAIALLAQDKYQHSELLMFFANPNNIPESKLPPGIMEKLKSSVKRIADNNVRLSYINIFGSYIAEGRPLSLLFLEKTDDLPLLVAADHLGVDPLAFKSWQLNQNQRETLEAILARFSSANPGLLRNINLPFKPREGIKTSPDFNNLLVEWFGTLDFLDRLPPEMEGKELLIDHIKKLKDLQGKYNISQDTLDIPREYLVGVASELNNVKHQALESFLGLVGLKEKGITFEEFKKFTNSWDGDIRSLITLSLHYQSIYPEGLPLLGEVIESLMKENYESKRYDISDSLTRRQLGPILDVQSLPAWRRLTYSIMKKSREEELIGIWREKLPHFKTITETKKERQELDVNALKEELKLRLGKEGHNHLEELFSLEELQGLSDDQKSDITEVLTGYLGDQKKTLDLGKFKRDLNGQVSPEHLNQLIALSQFFKTLLVDRKSPAEISSSLERTLAGIEKNWPELTALQFISGDLGEYVKQKLKEANESYVETVAKAQTFLTFFTDHPKTLFEIGKYPDPSSCQNFESGGTLNKHLLGYIFDSQIKALNVVEIEGIVEIPDDVLNKSPIQIDEGRRKLEITLPGGQKKEVSFTRPVARRIVMLGQKDSEVIYAVEPTYSRGVDVDFVDEQMDQSMQMLQDAFKRKGVKSKVWDKEEKGVRIAGSHNPAGHYNDLSRGDMGENGESYDLIKDNSRMFQDEQ